MKFISKLFEAFDNEKLMSDQPFVEKPIPENPVWMKQPLPDDKKPLWLRPIKFNVEN